MTDNLQAEAARHAEFSRWARPIAPDSSDPAGGIILGLALSLVLWGGLFFAWLVWR